MGGAVGIAAPKRRRDATPYLLVGPAVVLVALIIGYPVVRVLYESLLSPTTEGTVVGFNNYGFIFDDPVFWTSVRNNIFLVSCTPILVALSVFLAAILFDRIRGARIYRATIFLPYVLAVPVVALTFIYLYGLNGIVNTALRSVNADVLTRDWLADQTVVMPAVFSVILYREVGFGVILFLARMSSINEELYDAAAIDGAGWWARLRYVTVPQMRTVIAFYLTVELLEMLSSVFAYVYVLTAGGPANSTSILELYIYKEAFAYQSYGIASAIAVILVAITGVFMILRIALTGEQDTGEE